VHSTARIAVCAAALANAWPAPSPPPPRPHPSFIAARIPGEDAFLINDYRLLWEEITASSLRRVPLREADRSDEQGKPGVRRAWFNEASLEGATAMFQNRSEAACFLHTHTLATSTVGSLEGGLLPVSQPGIMLANDVAHSHFDFFQPGDETVAAMGGKRAMLQKWHGAFVAGASLGQCFYIALSLDRACEAQRALLSTGAPFHVPAPADVARWSQAYVDDPFYGGYDGERVWEGMLRKARRLQPDFAQ